MDKRMKAEHLFPNLVIELVFSVWYFLPLNLNFGLVGVAGEVWGQALVQLLVHWWLQHRCLSWAVVGLLGQHGKWIACPNPTHLFCSLGPPGLGQSIFAENLPKPNPQPVGSWVGVGLAWPIYILRLHYIFS